MNSFPERFSTTSNTVISSLEASHDPNSMSSDEESVSVMLNDSLSIRSFSITSHGTPCSAGNSDSSGYKFSAGYKESDLSSKKISRKLFLVSADVLSFLNSSFSSSGKLSINLSPPRIQ